MLILTTREMIFQKLNRYLLVIVFSGLVFFSNSCAYIKELSALKQCEFRYGTLENPVLAGIDIEELNNIEDLKMRDMGQIAQSIFTGKLPLSFTIYLDVKNPNPDMASMNTLEYIAYIDESKIAEGEINERIEIPAKGVASVPIFIQTDIIEILHKEPRNALINFALNLTDSSKKPTRVGMKIKPHIRIGEKDLVYPGYISIKHEFGTEVDD